MKASLCALLMLITSLSHAANIGHRGTERETIPIGEKPSRVREMEIRIPQYSPKSKPPKLNPHEWLTPDGAEPRVWTSQKGTTLEGKIIRFHKHDAVIATDDGRTVKIARAALSDEDNSYLSSIEKTKEAERQSEWRKKRKFLQARSKKPLFKTGCPQCGGKGTVTKSRSSSHISSGARRLGSIKYEAQCGYCKGTGRHGSSSGRGCHWCGSKGCSQCAWDDPNESVNQNGVRVPKSYQSRIPGVYSNIRIKCPNCGGSGFVGGLLGATEARAHGEEPEICEFCRGQGILKSR